MLEYPSRCNNSNKVKMHSHPHGTLPSLIPVHCPDLPEPSRINSPRIKRKKTSSLQRAATHLVPPKQERLNRPKTNNHVVGSRRCSYFAVKAMAPSVPAIAPKRQPTPRLRPPSYRSGVRPKTIPSLFKSTSDHGWLRFSNWVSRGIS